MRWLVSKREPMITRSEETTMALYRGSTVAGEGEAELLESGWLEGGSILGVQ